MAYSHNLLYLTQLSTPIFQLVGGDFVLRVFIEYIVLYNAVKYVTSLIGYSNRYVTPIGEGNQLYQDES